MKAILTSISVLTVLCHGHGIVKHHQESEFNTKTGDFRGVIHESHSDKPDEHKYYSLKTNLFKQSENVDQQVEVTVKGNKVEATTLLTKTREKPKSAQQEDHTFAVYDQGSSFKDDNQREVPVTDLPAPATDNLQQPQAEDNPSTLNTFVHAPEMEETHTTLSPTITTSRPSKPKPQVQKKETSFISPQSSHHPKRPRAKKPAKKTSPRSKKESFFGINFNNKRNLALFAGAVTLASVLLFTVIVCFCCDGRRKENSI